MTRKTHWENIYWVPTMPVTELGSKDQIMIKTMNHLSVAYDLTGYWQVTISYNSAINAMNEGRKIYWKST